MRTESACCMTGAGTSHFESPLGPVAARLVISVACMAAVWSVARFVVSPALEWRVLAMAALAFAASTVRVEMHGYRGGRVTFQLSHVVLFAGALTLGPAGAALPAVFSGSCRLLVTEPRRRPLVEVISTLFARAAVCSVAGSIYGRLGGDLTQIFDSNAAAPAMAAAVAYALASMVVAAALERVGVNSTSANRRLPALASAWVSCFVGGYLLATLYAVAPSYVLIAPALAAAFAGAIAPVVYRGETVEQVQADQTTEETQPAPAARGATNTLPESFVDPATGLASRRYLEMFLRSEVNRCERFGKRVTLAVFDIDESRKLHDSGAMEQLDEAVREIGARLKSGLREYDIVARYSSGRLAVVLPEVGGQRAFEIIERLHSSTTPTGKQEPLSATAGLASYPDNASTAEDLVNAAHRALNRGRFEGPNKVYGCETLDKAS